MKIASIVPINNSSKAFEGKYSMILAPLADHFVYAAAKKPLGNFTIVDNGAYEDGKPVDIMQLVKAAASVDGDEIILPDVLGDKDNTVYLTTKAIDTLASNGLINRFRLMAVCQGSTIKEFEQCFKLFDSNPYIDTIGIPKIAGELRLDGRAGLEYIWRDTKKAIHLLGCNKNLMEFKQFAHPDKIRSADTCIPALLSIRSSRGNAFEDRPEITIDLKKDSINIERYKKIMKQLAAEGLV
jgi:hypothetical protein